MIVKRFTRKILKPLRFFKRSSAAQRLPPEIVDEIFAHIGAQLTHALALSFFLSTLEEVMTYFSPSLFCLVELFVAPGRHLGRQHRAQNPVRACNRHLHLAALACLWHTHPLCPSLPHRANACCLLFPLNLLTS